MDNTILPHGQFVRDVDLILGFNFEHNTYSMPGSQRFFDFRPQNSDYHNGEYLSQGLFAITGRSCVTSLEELASSGLCELYPEFGEPGGKTEWANRVLGLCKAWQEESLKTPAELLLALTMAESCSTAGYQIELALMLPGFRDRRLFGPACKSVSCFGDEVSEC